MEIPYDLLSADALRSLVEEFVTREGTDYGHTEWDLERKVEAVMRQLKYGEAAIVYDEESGTPNIVLKKDLREEG
ncbi:MAG TPA: YheU family protein [Thermodesulfobacteriota bacterium]|nr:YheU family protein [Thermodesulfobacteriota bacterium]